MSKNYEDIKVLLVDDDEDNRWILSRGLKRLGFDNKHEAENGQKALDFLADNPDVDAILLDRMMPVMHGLEMYKEMCKHPEYDHITVIFQTGRTSIAELDEVLGTGAIHLLKKPFDPEDLGAFLLPVAVKKARHSYFTQTLPTATAPDKNASFTLKHLDEARELAVTLAKGAANEIETAEAIYGLIENAIEHGHACITHHKASLLTQSFKEKIPEKDFYFEELERRLSEEGVAEKQVSVTYEKKGDQAVITIEDEGEGFQHELYGVVNRHRLVVSHGRGIAYACNVLGEVEYNEAGNVVRCVAELA